MTHGPLGIVGTLSAAYPALTVLFARVFLVEQLAPVQYLAVTLVIGGCLGLSHTPSAGDSQVTSRRWIPLSSLALVCWGASNARCHPIDAPARHGDDAGMRVPDADKLRLATWAGSFMAPGAAASAQPALAAATIRAG